MDLRFTIHDRDFRFSRMNCVRSCPLHRHFSAQARRSGRPPLCPDVGACFHLSRWSVPDFRPASKLLGSGSSKVPGSARLPVRVRSDADRHAAAPRHTAAVRRSARRPFHATADRGLRLLAGTRPPRPPVAACADARRPYHALPDWRLRLRNGTRLLRPPTESRLHASS